MFVTTCVIMLWVWRKLIGGGTKPNQPSQECGIKWTLHHFIFTNLTLNFYLKLKLLLKKTTTTTNQKSTCTC